MKQVFYALGLVLLMCGVVNAQSSEDLRAIAEKNGLKTIQALRLSGTFTRAGATGTFTMELKGRQKARLVLRTSNSETEMLWNGSQSWTRQIEGGGYRYAPAHVASQQMLQQLALMFGNATDLTNPAVQIQSVTDGGTTMRATVECAGLTRNVVVDKSTGLVIAERFKELQEGNIDVDYAYSAFRQVNGVVIPTKIDKTVFGQHGGSWTITSVDPNPEILDIAFEKGE